MLELVQDAGGGSSRLTTAARHIEVAIAHLANAAQSRVPRAANESAVELEEVQLMVRALADIRDRLREWPAGVQIGG
jgi:hypothetical protein